MTGDRAGAIERVAVLGAGVMGAQIAAHCANAGLDVLLLDQKSDGPAPNAVAERALIRMTKADPAPFMSKRFAKKLRLGNFDDDMARLSDRDWIVEAVVERLDVKHDLYRKVDAAAPANAILSSNTSTLKRAHLVEGMSEARQARFLVTHFFNPPRYMRLLELVAPHGADALESAFARFAEERLGKSVVRCADSPGFIANRLGVFWIQAAIAAAVDMGLSIEAADALMGRPFGFPKTGVFGLVDLVGLDLIPHVDRSMRAALPENDAYHRARADMPLVEKLIADGYTGRKGKGGFYRLNRDGGGKVKEAIDLETGRWAKAEKPHLLALDAAKRDGPAALLDAGDVGAAYAGRVLAQTFAYACDIAFDIASDVASVDEAMRLGYNWKRGPFALIDALGPARVTALLRDQGLEPPPLLARAVENGGFFADLEHGERGQLAADGARRPILRAPGTLLLEDVKRKGAPIERNGSAAFWDLGDGVLGFELTTKMNTLDEAALALLGRASLIVPKHGRALVIGSDASNFSAGANLGLALFAANIAAWSEIDKLVRAGQRAIRALKYAPFPVVAAPAGLALGGGCEICLAADAVVAHAETYMGLVETGVGIVPAWGGCAEMLARYATDPRRPKGPVAPTVDAFRTIGLATVAKSAFEAQEIGYVRARDPIVFHRERVLAAAKAHALALSSDYTPPEKTTLRLAGATARAAIDLAVHDLDQKGQVTPHDKAVVRELSGVLSGGDADWSEPIGEDALLALERAAFMRLIRTEGTLLRMEHMLETGKPLRN